MDLYKLPEKAKGYPDGLKFSLIAFDADRPNKRVLVDVHPPKGPHIHFDEDSQGVPFEWKGYAEAERLFFQAAIKHFGLDPEDAP